MHATTFRRRRPTAQRGGRTACCFATTNVGANRLGINVGKIVEEVPGHLFGLPRATTEVKLKTLIRIPDAAPDHVARTVARTATH